MPMGGMDEMGMESALSLGAFVVAWVAMMAAMMFPAVLPVVRLYGQAAARGRAQQRRQAAVLAERHLQVEHAVLLPRAVVPHDVGVLRQRRHRLDLVQAPARPVQRLVLKFYLVLGVISAMLNGGGEKVFAQRGSLWQWEVRMLLGHAPLAVSLAPQLAHNPLDGVQLSSLLVPHAVHLPRLRW